MMDVRFNGSLNAPTMDAAQQSRKTSLFDAQQALKLAGYNHPAGSYQADTFRKAHKDWPVWTDS